MASMRDQLHDEIDLAEEHRAQARDVVEKTWEHKLAVVMREAEGQGDGSPWGDIIVGLQMLVQDIGNGLAGTTTRAVKEMAKLGEKRSKAGNIGESLGDVPTQTLGEPNEP